MHGVIWNRMEVENDNTFTIYLWDYLYHYDYMGGKQT